MGELLEKYKTVEDFLASDAVRRLVNAARLIYELKEEIEELKAEIKQIKRNKKEELANLYLEQWY